MKKKYKRIIKGILTICLSFFLCLEVNAKECTADYGEAANDNLNGAITISSKSGEFRVLKFVGGVYESEFNLSAGGKLTINYTPRVEQVIDIILVYSGNDECYKNGVSLIDSIKADMKYADDGSNTEMGIYKRSYQFEINGPVVKGEVQNKYYDNICKSFREGEWISDFEGYITPSDLEKYNPRVTNSEAEYRGLFPYCYAQTVSTNYSKKDVLYRIDVAIRTYKFRHRTLDDNKQVEIPEENEKTFKNTSNIKLGLSCDVLKLDTVNKHTYTAIEETSKEYKTTKTTYVCNTTCTEILTVEYDPPVASKAGLCFEYKVKVTSEVTCKTSGTSDAEPPNPDDYKYCEPIPQCVSSIKITNSPDAGPNEDFDKCINKCDKGKYTQKCIDKCYKQVYSSGTNQRLNYIDKVEATQLANCRKELDQNKPDAATLSDLVTGTSYNTNKCYGKYKGENGKITWVSGTGGHWSQYARYYLSSPSKAQETINHDKINADDGNGKRVNSEYRYYSPTTEGFKTWTWYKEDSGKTGGARCDYTCSYIGCSPDDKLNPDDVKGDYEDDMSKYEEFLTDCTAKAKCSKQIAEFTIKINNKTKDNPDDDNWIDYNTATLQNTGSSVDITDSSNIILDRAKCYGKIIEKNKYMTEWSFPGTWINNKTGEISYESKNGNTWHKKENEFCTSVNTANTNVGWWYYGDTGKKINGVTGETMTDQDLKNAVTDYNIEATAKKFGHFSWDIDIKCFYAYYDSAGAPVPPKPDPEENKKCIDKNCDDIEDKDPSQRYRIRTVSNSDLFPSPEGKATTNLTEPGRQPGFNWTVSATNTKNPNYIIAPSALLAEIQTKGDSIYSDDSNVDYEFYLDRNALSSIRKHITSGNYTNFTGNFSIINGVSVYSSSLFRESNNAAEVSLDSKYVIKKGILGCNNEENGKCYNYPSLTSIGG